MRQSVALVPVCVIKVIQEQNVGATLTDAIYRVQISQEPVLAETTNKVVAGLVYIPVVISSQIGNVYMLSLYHIDGAYS